MKKMKKLFALLLTMAMVLGMAVCVSADAATTFTLSLKTGDKTDGHSYKVYQIFTGDYSDGKLSNLKYGDSGYGTKGESVADSVIDGIGTDAAGAEAFAKNIASSLTHEYTTALSDTNTSVTVPAGYYLIIDDTSKELSDGDTYSKYMVEVVKNTTIDPKSTEVPSDKKEYNDQVTEATVNDAGVGTAVSYKLTGTIATDAGDYDYYNFILADTLSDGLTFNDDVTVTIGGNAATKGTDYAIYKGEDGYTFEVALLNAKAHAGEIVVATYSATLNSNAVAMEPETNKYTVIYSNNPEHSYKGDQDGSEPGKPSSITSDVFGKTPEVTTYTYDTKVELTKVDEDGNALEGATFELKSTDANQTILANKEYYYLDAEGSYYLLKNGTYTDEAPAGTDVEYIEAGTGDANTTAGYIKDGENYVVPTNKADYKGKTLYIKKVTADSEYASFDTYKQGTTTENASKSAPVDIILTTDSDGKITFDGLGTGHYTLTEVDAPDGFNYASEISFDLNFDATNKTFTLTNASNAEFTDNSGTFTTTVTDKSGSTLPTTGGMGTTLFYLFGGILVVGAGIILVSKKRMAR